jgi:NADH:ubiquinone reductase (non-electrogenic)
MASSSRALARFAPSQIAKLQLPAAATSRLLTTSSKLPARAGRVALNNNRIAALSREFRRQYSDAPSATLSPQPPKKRRFRVLRWTWRLTYLSVLGSIGYLGWQIYEDRHPDEQIEADPNKKTLVILGMFTLFFCLGQT